MILVRACICSSVSVSPFLFFTQDRLIQLQNSARDNHESQISTLEKRSKKALDRCIQLAELVEKTETRGNVLSTAYDEKPCDKCT